MRVLACLYLAHGKWDLSTRVSPLLALCRVHSVHLVAALRSSRQSSLIILPYYTRSSTGDCLEAVVSGRVSFLNGCGIGMTSV